MFRRYFVDSLGFFVILGRALRVKALRRAARLLFPIALAALAVSEVTES
jgi:hypothetical protein